MADKLDQPDQPGQKEHTEQVDSTVHTDSANNNPSQPSRPKIKKRKSQSEEDFQRQAQLYQKGPVVQTPSWLLQRDYNSVDHSAKIERGYLKSAAERAFYMRDYPRAIELCDVARDQGWDQSSKDFQELEHLRNKAMEAMARS
uniref:ARAD1D13222p n=1 Tax=Blastobotrys adeninivorans TaxID=409370 RepID=A0A060T967_BLAAD